MVSSGGSIRKASLKNILFIYSLYTYILIILALRDPILAPSTSMENMEVLVASEMAQKNNPNSRNVFAIIVSYYVKVRSFA
jgi:hypothetical protein